MEIGIALGVRGRIASTVKELMVRARDRDRDRLRGWGYGSEHFTVKELMPRFDED